MQSAIDGAKSAISTCWTNISTAISGIWDTLKTSASTAWSGITGAVSTAITSAKEGIVNGWTAIKTGVKSAWDGVLNVIKSPITSASTWLSEKIEWFKGLFNFQWKLPEFKLPKINVKWKDIGWGIKLPSLSVSWNALGGIFDKPTIFNTASGLQGVGEAGPEAILPLDTLWAEMSARLKAAMMDVMASSDLQSQQQNSALEAMLRGIVNGISQNKAVPVNVTQNIYAENTSYVEQQREAARNFRQIARQMA